ncbi:STAS domain-containing protein [Candidatus Nitrospira allomarina]|jgi:anti-anti-sigma factor|uniref:STAS domain-containing protein n=1 Tax=Candidatus Nitrospira allomarina TaxID=3020900 RepID=A0AA96JRR9_9BACT|nr:STAS domain-containing protein [Candidatus Nitrospira allomarina]WNM57255.1 STAS domain-containing protein [Candidatus Nitrospira allomarina]
MRREEETFVKVWHIGPIRFRKIMAIEVIIRGIRGATVVDFHGRLDMHSRWHVKAIINQCCHTEQEHLILNLKGLTFVDSAGLGFLVLCSYQFKELRRRISWIQPQGCVGELLQNLQIHELISVCQSEKDALSAVSPS